MKNILIASSAPPDRSSGISTYSKELAACFSKRKFVIHYLSPTPNDYTWIRENNISFVASDPSADQKRTCADIIRYINRHNIDVIINNDNSALQSLASMVHCPFITIGHLEKYSIAKVATHNDKWVDYVVAISNDMHATFTHKYGIATTKCPVIHNGVASTSAYVHRRRKENDRLKIVFAGGYSRRKGADLIIPAITTEHDLWSRAELHWFGDLPEKIRLKLKPYTNVVVHGSVTRDVLLDHLESSDVFLLPSREEGCPMAMLEAMRYGVVPIASNGRGAMRWLINHGIEGYICHLDKYPTQMIECLDFLSRRNTTLSDMQNAVRKRYLAEFTIDHTVDKLLTLISNPTVNRTSQPTSTKILRWHRPTSPTLLDKVCWKLGVLRFCGILRLP